eukprot:888100-Ditylum_brightwellii.AAC.1
MTKSKASNAAAYSKRENQTSLQLRVSINTCFKVSNNKKEHPEGHDVCNQDGGSHTWSFPLLRNPSTKPNTIDMTEEDSPTTPVSDSAKKRRILSPDSDTDIDEEDDKAIPVTPE